MSIHADKIESPHADFDSTLFKMPSVVVTTTRIYITFLIPKGITLLEPHEPSNSEPGPEKPWSWYCRWNTLTYWDDKGVEHEIMGNEQDSGNILPEDTEIDDGKNWGYESEDEEDSDDETECEFCDLPEFECVTKKEGEWSDCRGYLCAPPKGKKKSE